MTGRFLRINPRLCVMTGRSDAALFCMAFPDIVHPADRERAVAALCRLHRSELDIWQLELRLAHADGSTRWALVDGTPVRGGDGAPHGLLAIHDITERKRLEDEHASLRCQMQLERARLAQALRQIPCGLTITDATGKAVLCSEEGERILMRSPGAVDGYQEYPFFVAYHADGRRYAAEEYPMTRALLTGSETRHEEMHYIRGDGVATILSINASPIHDAENRIAGAVCTYEDVSARRRIEEEARAARQDAERNLAQMEALIGSMADGLIVADTEGSWLRWNTAALAMFGYRTMAECGRNVYDMAGTWTLDLDNGRELTPDEWPINRALRGERFAQLELIARRLDGTQSWVGCYGGTQVHDRAGNLIAAVLTVRDITARKQAEHALRASELRFRSFFELAAVGTCQCDPATMRFTAVNDRMCQMLGYEREALLSMTFLDITHPDDRRREAANFEDFLAGAPREYVREKRYVRKDGTVMWGHLSAVLVRDDDGTPTQSLGILHDITARKRAEAAILDADRRKDEFLAMLAHELRNPLSAVQNALMLVQQPGLAEALRARAIQVMNRQVKQLGRLIDDLLDVSRITRDKIRLEVQRIALGEVLRQAVAAVAPLVEARAHRLEVDVAEEALWIDGDPARIEQVIVNLLTNAAKYTREGGWLWLILGREGEQAVIRVKDTGIGIAPEMLPRIFDMFIQGQHTLDRAQGGLGIGLTLVKRLVEMHGGTVSAISEGEGHGCELVVRLPLAGASDGDAQRA